MMVTSAGMAREGSRRIVPAGDQFMIADFLRSDVVKFLLRSTRRALRVRREARAMLQEEHAAARRFVKRQKAAIDAVADALFEKKSLDGEAVAVRRSSVPRRAAPEPEDESGVLSPEMRDRLEPWTEPMPGGPSRRPTSGSADLRTTGGNETSRDGDPRRDCDCDGAMVRVRFGDGSRRGGRRRAIASARVMSRRVSREGMSRSRVGSRASGVRVITICSRSPSHLSPIFCLLAVRPPRGGMVVPFSWCVGSGGTNRRITKLHALCSNAPFFASSRHF